ncbi:MAG: hypothetical protein LH613_18505 [Chamaesiphon sp.]|nr:hypothetical protein [Chamaesiphon sp.]
MNSTSTNDKFSRNRSILALLLIVPPSSIGAISSTVLAPGAIGQGIALGCGIWMLVLPIGWHLFIDRQPLKLRCSPHDGLVVGIILGAMMFGTIFASYWFIGRYWLNIPDIRSLLPSYVSHLAADLALQIVRSSTHIPKICPIESYSLPTQEIDSIDSPSTLCLRQANANDYALPRARLTPTVQAIHHPPFTSTLDVQFFTGKGVGTLRTD